MNKVIKNSLFSYMIHVQENSKPNISFSQDVQMCNTMINKQNAWCIPKEDSNKDEDVRNEFLKQFEDFFLDSLPSKLPPEHGNDDHKKDLIPRSVAPNQLIYKLSRTQQEEFISQVQELLRKGLIRSSSSPFSHQYY